MKIPGLIIFDVNETLLDLNPLKEKINKVLRNEQAFEIWFRSLLHYSLVETTTNSYNDFGSIGKATFKMTAQSLEVNLGENEIEDILGLIKKLPPHPDVIDGLKKLKDAGHILVTLTNGNYPTLREQLSHAEIREYFTEIFSVDSVSKYKPHCETYLYVLEQMNISSKNAMLVAAHGWDITGAKKAGLQTAFISRLGKFKYPLAQDSDYTANTILELANQLLK